MEILPEAIQQQVREGKVSAQVAMKFLVPVARVPRLMDGRIDLDHKSGQLIDAKSGHVDVKNTTDVTIVLTAKCPTGTFERLPCLVLGNSIVPVARILPLGSITRSLTCE